MSRSMTRQRPVPPALVILACATVALIGLIRAESFRGPMQLADGDGWMRGLRLQALLAGQDPDFVAQGNVPDGFIIHWTLPYDVLILGLRALFLGAGVEADRALELAMLSSPLLLVFGMLVAAGVVLTGLQARFGRLPGAGAEPFSSGPAYRQAISPAVALSLATLALFATPVFHAYATPVRVDHHLLASTFIFLSLGALLWARTTRGQILSGILAGVAVWTAIEAVPYILLLCGGGLVALAWQDEVAGIAARRSLRFWIGVAAATSLAFLLDPPYDGHFLDIDRISLVYVLLPLGIAAATSALALLLDWWLRAPDRPGPGAAITAGGLIMGTVATLLAFPDVVRGPEALLGPELTELWWNQIREIGPPRDLVVFGGVNALPLLAAGMASVLWFRRALHARGADRRAVALVIVCLAMLAGLGPGLIHLRFAHWGLPIALVTGALLFVGMPNQTQRALALLVLLALPMGLIALGVAVKPSTGRDDPRTASSPDCSPQKLARFMQAAGIKRLEPDPNDVAELMFHNPRAQTLSGSFQRNVRGLADRYRLLRTEDPTLEMAEAILVPRGLFHIALCPASGPITVGAGTLEGKLRDGRAPDWFTRIGGDADTGGYAIWEFRPDAARDRAP